MLKEIKEGDFPRFYEIMTEAFPSDERRSEAGQRSLFSRKNYHVYAETSSGEILGFIAVHEFSKFRFVEHFAVLSCARGRGIGTAMLSEYVDMSRTPVILEVELPETEIQRRRIAFYQRAGFTLTPYEYIMPSLGAGKAEIPMHIMSRGGEISAEEFEKIKREIYTAVYGVSL